ncbi:MAG: phosphate ABC transporter ATP-binding protein [Methanotrichaceae archaeon]
MFLELKGIRKCYGRSEVLKNINLNVENGDILALIGPTGSGKTTLLKIIDLLEAPSFGNILFDGIDMIAAGENERLKARRRMAMVFQKPVMFKGSVLKNVLYGLKIRGKDGTDLAKDVLHAVGLSGYEDRDASTLSGGEMQRTALARALVTEPELLLLDEPTANLDPKTAASIEKIISGLPGQGATVIMATHNMLQSRRLAERVAMLIDGGLTKIGRPDEILGEDGLSAMYSGTSAPW